VRANSGELRFVPQQKGTPVTWSYCGGVKKMSILAGALPASTSHSWRGPGRRRRSPPRCDVRPPSGSRRRQTEKTDRVDLPLFCFEAFQSTVDPRGTEVAGTTVPEHGRTRIRTQTAQMG